jgi:von Willebrand factor type A domain/Bacterial pre-peptidase C-terminal domain
VSNPVLLWPVAALTLIVSSVALAAPCAPAAEHNDTLASAESVDGEFCRSGQSSGDARQLFRFTVSASGTGNLWSFALEALPGQAGRLEFFELVPGANGQDITKAPLRAAVNTAPGSSSLTTPPLLLHQGSYALAVSAIGGKLLYRLRAQNAGALAPASAGAQQDGFVTSLSAADHPIEIPWHLSTNAAAQRWTIALQAPPGTRLPLTLRDEKGADVLASSTADTQGVERLADLGLPAGSYRIVVGALAGTPMLLSAAADGARAADFAEEPDNAVERAHALSPNATVRGRLIPQMSDVDVDTFGIDVDPTLAGRPLDFTFRTTGDGRVTLELVDAKDQSLATMAGSHDVRLTGMTLMPGRYFVKVRGALGASQSYTLDAQAGATQQSSQAIEPNNTPGQATHVIAGQNVSGTLSATDRLDYLSIDVSKGLELWNLEVLGEGVSRVVLYSASGTELATARPAGGLRPVKLSRVLLPQGSHVILIEGDRGSWLFRAENLGAPKPGDEIEPNDRISNALPLVPGVEHRGWLDHSGDVDRYTFYLPAEHRVTFTLGAPADFPVGARLDWGDRLDLLARFVTAPGADGVQHAVWTGVLPPGDYFLTLAADNGGASDFPYTLHIDPARYFEPASDLEPNDTPWQARPVPPDFKLDGDLYPRDNDWFQLPAQSGGTTLTVAASAVPKEGLDFAVLRPRPGGGPNDLDKIADVLLSAQSATQSMMVPAGTPLLVRIQGGAGPYHLALSLGRTQPAALTPIGVSASLSFSAVKIAAFEQQSQEVQGKLHLHSSAQRALTLRSKSWIGDMRWSVSGLPTEIPIAPGADLDIPIVLHVAPDARDDWPIETQVALTGDGGIPVLAVARIEPTIGVDAVAPGAASAVPGELRGGLDVAWAALGGKTDPAHGGLIDGAGAATALSVGQPVTIQLTSGGSHRIAGVSLTPPAVASLSERVREFKIAVSEDGSRYQDVLQGRLWPVAREQYYLLSPRPQARFVQLTAVNVHGDPSAAKALLSQLKVIEDPAGQPDGAPGFDLARADLGGHVVWASPQPNRPVTGDALLWPGNTITLRNSAEESTAPVEWVMAFRSDRTALIQELSWRDRPDTVPEQRIKSVDIAVGTESPYGPWTALGTWSLAPGGDGFARFKLPQTSAVKYVRYRVTAPAAGRVAFPDRLGITEQPVSSSYRSVVGEWGGESNQSAVDASRTALVRAASASVAHDRSAATALAVGTLARGVVRLGQSSDWYRIELPAQTRELTVQITGDPAPDAAVRVEDSKGVALAITPVADAPGRYTAPATTGTYFIEVSQPPRSVIVAWDTSTSVGPFVEGIERVVQRLSRDLVVGQQEVNLIPFRGDQSVPLLEPWGTTAADVYGSLSSYTWMDNSSDAEGALISADKAFGSRPGTHAIALITDAQSSTAEKTATLWKTIAAERPRVFALKIPAAGSAAVVRAEMNLMEDWAYSNGGFYDLFASQGDGEVEFRRMAAWLREPASYGLSYSIGTGPLPPGRLAVTWASLTQSADPSRAAVAVLLDASGSMLKRIGGKQKIEIAKQLLSDLLTKSVPPKTPLMIRVFGQGGAGSCRSDLVAPLAPLDVAKTAAVIAGIHSTNGAKTAIGDSLRLAGEDMASAKGPRQLVLITDGGEDCGGDPAAEIQKLRALGFDVRINIVGFAVDEPQTRELFQKWATLGGGHFFDSSDQASLDKALQQALAQGFEVVAADGKVVAQGVVGGDSVSVATGSYSVRFSGSGAKAIGSAQVVSGETTKIEAVR